MRVCSFCGERNEDWMEICQRCGNSIVNANTYEDYKSTSKEKKTNVNNYSYNQNDSNYYYEEKKQPRVVENFDLKIIIVLLLLILITLIAYTIYVLTV